MLLCVNRRAAGRDRGCILPAAAKDKLISTLSITVIVESITVIGYCVWRRKRIRPILLTSICLNFITQFLLWVVLNIFFQQYVIALLVAEIFIWLFEGLALYFIRPNQLRWAEALSLSLIMNLAIFAIGWFLPT